MLRRRQEGNKTRMIEKAPKLANEKEEGNVEYKLKLVGLSDEQMIHRITQMNWRLNEGNNEAFYQIGFKDNGDPIGLNEEEFAESLDNLTKIAEKLNSTVKIVKLMKGEHGHTAQVQVKRKERSKDFPVHISVGVVGALGSGKSSLVGSLITGTLDNGHGLIRNKVFKHQHEVMSGMTSSITRHNMYLDDHGNTIPLDNLCTLATNNNNAVNSTDVVTNCERVISFLDLAGHDKYFRNTLFGLVSRSPECCILTIAPSMQSIDVHTMQSHLKITTEHLGVLLALQHPIVIVITKIDVVPREKMLETISFVERLLKSCKKQPRVQQEGSEEMFEGLNLKDDVPIFLVSTVTGMGLTLLKKFLFKMPWRNAYWEKLKSSDVVEVKIFDKYETYVCERKDESVTEDQLKPQGRRPRPGSLELFNMTDEDDEENDDNNDAYVASKSDADGLLSCVTMGLCKAGNKFNSSCVLTGSVASGTLTVGSKLFFGPNLQGKFLEVTIKSIYLNKIPVSSAGAGQCIGIEIVASDTMQSLSSAVDDNNNSLPIESKTTQELLNFSSLKYSANSSNSISSSLSLEGMATPVKTAELDSTETTSSPSPTVDFVSGSKQGQFLLGNLSLPEYQPMSYWEFDSEVLVLQHPTGLKLNCELVIHIGVVRQVARLISISSIDGSQVDVLTMGKKGVCRFRFCYYPEYFKVEDIVILRDGRIRGVEKVTFLSPPVASRHVI